MDCLSVQVLSSTVSNLNSCSENKLPQTTKGPEASQDCSCQLAATSGSAQGSCCSTAGQECHWTILCSKQQRSSATYYVQ